MIVEFNRARFVSDFMVFKEILEKSDGPISVLHYFAKLLEGGITYAGICNTYKVICSSNISKVLFADQVKIVRY